MADSGEGRLHRELLNFEKLGWTNYLLWQKDVNVFFKVGQLTEHLCPTKVPPDVKSSPEEYGRYQANASKAFGYLFLSLDADNKLLVGQCTTAREV